MNYLLIQFVLIEPIVVAPDDYCCLSQEIYLFRSDSPSSAKSMVEGEFSKLDTDDTTLTVDGKEGCRRIVLQMLMDSDNDFQVIDESDDFIALGEIDLDMTHSGAIKFLKSLKDKVGANWLYVNPDLLKD